MNAVRKFELDDATAVAPTSRNLAGLDLAVANYKAASVGATTDEPKRRERLGALESALFPQAKSTDDEDR